MNELNEDPPTGVWEAEEGAGKKSRGRMGDGYPRGVGHCGTVSWLKGVSQVGKGEWMGRIGVTLYYIGMRHMQES